jgi:hypothetical protein
MSRIPSAVTTTSETDFAEVSIVTAGALAFALISIFLCVVPLSSKATSTRDFVVFWATGHQLINHSDPYDPTAMDRLERSAGLAAEYGVLYMRNPPWALPLVLPLGFMNEQLGALFWSLCLLACLMLSGRILRTIQGNPKNRIHWIAYSFAPSLICLFMGQTTLFALFGLVLFLRYHRTNPFGAGLALWLVSLKPHLFLPFCVVLLAWVFVSKTYKILAGSAVALATSGILTWLLDPLAWKGYWVMMHAPAVEREFIPCLSVALRLWVLPDSVWIQYVPAGLACVWALVYYWQRRRVWNWLQHGGVLILVSLVAAPYCWPYDQTVAMPALLQRAYATRSRLMLAILALAGFPIMAALMANIKITTPFYLLIAPAWLAWYLAVGVRLEDPNELQPLDHELSHARGPQ